MRAREMKICGNSLSAKTDSFHVSQETDLVIDIGIDQHLWKVDYSITGHSPEEVRLNAIKFLESIKDDVSFLIRAIMETEK